MSWDRIARRQAGIVTRAQLLAAGLSRDSIAGFLHKGVLVHAGARGLYRAAGAPHSPQAQAWLETLGNRAVLSYLSAGQWWEVPVESDGRIHITRFERQRARTHPLIRVHRTLLVPSAVTRRYGLQITTRTETLLDCLGWLPISQSRTLMDRAFQQDWLTPALIQRRLDEQSGRWGNLQLARLLRQSRPGAEAESERRLQRLLDEAGVLGWVGNYPIRLPAGSFRIDVAFPGARVAVEVDGWAFHRTKERRDRDMMRTNALMAAGWRVLTFSWEDVTTRPAYVLRAITEVLAHPTAM